MWRNAVQCAHPQGEAQDAKETPVKQCWECSVDLIPEDFVYERSTDDGRILREEVSGYRCPSCNERVLKGPDAVRISRRWYELLRSRSPASPAHTVSTGAPNGTMSETGSHELAHSRT